MTKQEQNLEVMTLFNFYRDDLISGNVPINVATAQLLDDLSNLFKGQTAKLFLDVDVLEMKADIQTIPIGISFEAKHKFIFERTKKLENQIIGRNKPNV